MLDTEVRPLVRAPAPLPHEALLSVRGLTVSFGAARVLNGVDLEVHPGEVTARNRVLETIREILETLAGPVPLDQGLAMALQALREGLQSDEVALISLPADTLASGTVVGSAGSPTATASPAQACSADAARWSVPSSAAW